MTCPRCQKESSGDAVFCQECGTRLETACPSCGTANQLGAKFCKKCGHEPTVEPPRHRPMRFLTGTGVGTSPASRWPDASWRLSITFGNRSAITSADRL